MVEAGSYVEAGHVLGLHVDAGELKEPDTMIIGAGQ
jgi:hypothetical protein